jgi:enamine deaminase RidA (YjgF/YER057c/UK114 family)
MLPRFHIRPEGHWALGLAVTNNSQALRCNKHVFVAGQVDLDSRTRIRHPGDLAAQARGAMEYVAAALQGAAADVCDLVKLTVFYVPHTAMDEDALLAVLASCLGDPALPGPAVTLVPVAYLAYPDMLIEIEGWAMRGLNGERLPRQVAWRADGPRLPRPFSQAVRCEEMIFTSGVTSADETSAVLYPGSLYEQSRVVLPKLDRLLRQLGATLADVVKANIFNVEPGTKEDWRAPALLRASHYPEPGPAATGISLPKGGRDGVMIVNDVIAMRNLDGTAMPRAAVWPDDHWDWTVHMPYRHGLKCGDLVFLGGQVPLGPDASLRHPGDMVGQTKLAMDYIGRVLDEFGMGFANVVKVNSFYAAPCGEQHLKPNAETRFGYFPAKGPVSTGVPVPWLAYEGMLTEIDIVAMV